MIDLPNGAQQGGPKTDEWQERPIEPTSIPDIARRPRPPIPGRPPLKPPPTLRGRQPRPMTTRRPLLAFSTPRPSGIPSRRTPAPLNPK